MAAQVISLMSRIRPAAPASRDWTQREIAEFYRVESALIQAGLDLESERGLSDEGDPWFAFCRVDTGEVFIHFARENGRYVVDGGPFGAAARGDDFAELVRELIARHPLASTRRSGSNVFLHPAALLIALVGACFFHSAQAKAAETPEGHAARVAATDASRRHAITLASGDAPPAGVGGSQAFVALDAAQTAAILTGVLIALRDAPSDAAASASVPTANATAAPAGTLAPIAPLSGGSDGLKIADAVAAPEAREVLAVVAVLHDLFRLQAPAAAPVQGVTTPATHAGLADAAVAPLSAPGAVDTAAPAASAAPVEDRAIVVVHLSVADLPHVQAVALILGAGVMKVIGDDHIDRLDHLPAALADVISHGEQVDLTTPTPIPVPAAHAPDVVGGADGTLPPPPTVDATHTDQAATNNATPAPTVEPTLPHAEQAGPAPSASGGESGGVSTASGSGSDGSSSGSGAGPGGTDGGGAGSGAGGAGLVDIAPAAVPPTPAPVVPDPAPPVVIQPTPVTSSPAPAPVPAPQPAPAADSSTLYHNPDIDAAVVRFAAQVHAAMIITGAEIVIYDPLVLQPLKAGDVLDSVTFHFSDGSSISLLGTAAELHDLHGLH